MFARSCKHPISYNAETRVDARVFRFFAGSSGPPAVRSVENLRATCAGPTSRRVPVSSRPTINVLPPGLTWRPPGQIDAKTPLSAGSTAEKFKRQQHATAPPDKGASKRDTPWKDVILALLSRLVWKRLQIGTDMLLIIHNHNKRWWRVF